MPAVCNTSPIVALAAIGDLELLREQHGAVVIPAAVLSELQVEVDRPGNKEITSALDAGWLRVAQVSDAVVVRLLERDLHAGEAETIALALELAAEWTILDERPGRSVAKGLGLKVVGVLGVL